MKNDNVETMQQPGPIAPSFAMRLKAAREALGLSKKDTGAQLRLNEDVINMMEKDDYPDNLPTTFIRGYLRAYAKLLQIPDQELKTALESIKARPAAVVVPLMNKPLENEKDLAPIFTFLILALLIGLIISWWYRHNAPPSLAANERVLQIEDQGPPGRPHLMPNRPAVLSEEVKRSLAFAEKKGGMPPEWPGVQPTQRAQNATRQTRGHESASAKIYNEDD